MSEPKNDARHAHPCPNCGHCPTCGRSNFGPRPYPYWPYGTWPWTAQPPYRITYSETSGITPPQIQSLGNAVVN